jgi:Na+/melibiose symporter-like transporter
MGLKDPVYHATIGFVVAVLCIIIFLVSLVIPNKEDKKKTQIATGVILSISVVYTLIALFVIREKDKKENPINLEFQANYDPDQPMYLN